MLQFMIIFKALFLKIFWKVFLIFSDYGPLVFSKTANPSSLYSPILLGLYLLPVKLNIKIPESSHTSAPIVTSKLYIYIHLIYRLVGELLPLETCFLQQLNVKALNGVLLAFKNLMKWLKTTAYNSLSRNLAENPTQKNSLWLIYINYHAPDEIIT